LGCAKSLLIRRLICRDTAVAVIATRQLGMNESALYPSAKVA
jgi:hypothetical protein